MMEFFISRFEKGLISEFVGGSAVETALGMKWQSMLEHGMLI